MAHIYTLYYIRDNKISASIQSEPQLISFAKIRNDLTPHRPRRFHAHAHCEIFYFGSGVGFFETPTAKIPLKENDVIIVNANQPHCQYSESDPPLIYYGIDMRGFKLDDLPENSFSEQSCLKFSLETPQNTLYACIENILREINRADEASAYEIKGITYQLFAALLRLKGTTENDEKPRGNFTFQLNEILRYLGENYAENITLDELAKKFFLSKSSLCHHFQKAFHIAPRKYILKLRIDRAKTLLSQTDLPIAQIAKQIGFQSSSYFTKYFSKSEAGVSPQEYRNRCRPARHDPTIENAREKAKKP